MASGVLNHLCCQILLVKATHQDQFSFKGRGIRLPLLMQGVGKESIDSDYLLSSTILDLQWTSGKQKQILCFKLLEFWREVVTLA